jgi:hypothetical protein
MNTLNDNTIVLVFCYDSDMVEHMTWGQYQKNGNSRIIGPQWVIDKIMEGRSV